MKTRLPIGLAVAVLALVALVVPRARALDTIYLVRHAEKVDAWPKNRDISSFQPLSPAGVARAERLAEHLAGASIMAVYASPTTRSLATGLPLALAAECALEADERTIRAETIPSFLEDLGHKHPGPGAVVVVAHSNTVPLLLEALGLGEGCRDELGVTKLSWGWGIEGYEGLWRVDLGKEGCAAAGRTPHP